MTHPLKKYRVENDLSQSDVAGLIGTTKQTVCRIETGTRTASAELMLKIAEMTGNKVTPNDLLLSHSGSPDAVAS